jgi:hypothetical protein
MYFFVPYNISDIQKGIQSGHAALEYVKLYGWIREYKDFIENSKTWIILNGGTTNSSIENFGTLDEIQSQLITNRITYTNFFEPDLNNALTALCFIADERVWDYENYPDYDSDVYEKSWVMRTGAMMAMQIEPKAVYQQWVDFVGGEKNVFLRFLIRDKRLA